MDLQESPTHQMTEGFLITLKSPLKQDTLRKVKNKIIKNAIIQLQTQITKLKE